MLTNLTSPHTMPPSSQVFSGNANQTVSVLVNQAQKTVAEANKLNITPKEQERSMLSTCPKAVSVQCLEGLSPTHLQSPFGAVFTGADELYVPNAWGDAIFVSQKDLDVLCAGNFDDAQKFVSTQNNNGTASLEDMRKHYGSGDVFCASEPFEDTIVRDSFKNIQPADLVIKDNVITPECPEDTYKTFKASSIPWDLKSGFRRTLEDNSHRNLKKNKRSSSSSGSGSGSGNECILPQAQCPELLIPAHKRVIPGTVVVNAFGKNLDIYYVPNSLGQTIQTNGNDVGVSCVRDLLELQQDYNKTRGFIPTFEQIRDDMGGGDVLCTNKVPDDKLYPTAFVVTSPALYNIENAQNNTGIIVPKCPEGTNSVFVTNPTPTTFGQADTGNKIKIIIIGTVVSASVIGSIGMCAYQLRNAFRD